MRISDWSSDVCSSDLQGQAGGLGSLRRAFRDDAAAFGGVDDDVAGAELLGIVARAADGDDAGMMEAVTNGGGAGFDAGDLEFNHSVAEEGDDALERADPAEAFGRSRGDAPAPRLGPGESARTEERVVGKEGCSRVR